MKISIDYIKDPGNIDKERIVFAVNDDAQLGQYLVAESRMLRESRFSSEIKNTYWFPDQELKKGDRVVLYTKKGNKNTTNNEDGSTTYFFYWGLDKSHYSNDKPCVVLFDATWNVCALPPKDE